LLRQWHLQWCETFYAEAAAMMMKCPHTTFVSLKTRMALYTIYKATSLVGMWLQQGKSKPNMYFSTSLLYYYYYSYYYSSTTPPSSLLLLLLFPILLLLLPPLC
jgi:hypothetical protein